MDKNAHRPGGKRKRARYIRSLDKIPRLSIIEKEELREVTEIYPFWATDYYLSLINWNDPDDPIRRLVIPDRCELDRWGDLDPSNEKSVTVVDGVQHKYSTTVLMLATENCAGVCRYCFRKRLFMKDNNEAGREILQALEYIRYHPEINNVLVTGGDPLVLSARKLDRILTKLRKIDHVRIIRIGTKTPAYNPGRIIDDTELIKVFRKHSRPDRRLYMMCHFDHPRELTALAREAIDLVLKAGVVCVNQNPIIRGVSDDPDVMADLWNELSYIGVPQYYVFQNRPTTGNKPYTVPITEAYYKIEEAKSSCSGLAKRTRYVMSHASGKVEIVGVDSRRIYLKYHRAKHARDEQRLLVCRRDDRAYWLDQLKPVDGFDNRYYRPAGEIETRIN